MVVVHKIEDEKVALSNNYTDLLGDWADQLVPLICSDYMTDLVHFIDEIYKGKKLIYPLRKDIFRAFKETTFEDLKVVVIGKKPYSCLKSNGLAFGCNPSAGGVITPTLKHIIDCINNTIYNGEQQVFDNSMLSWAKQGVLMLNTSLTSGMEDDHSIYWRNFIREVISMINTNKENIIFIFLGPDNELFEKYIGLTKHYILRSDKFFLPPQADIFIKANNIINDRYKDFEIVW